MRNHNARASPITAYPGQRRREAFLTSHRAGIGDEGVRYCPSASITLRHLAWKFLVQESVFQKHNQCKEK